MIPTYFLLQQGKRQLRDLIGLRQDRDTGLLQVRPDGMWEQVNDDISGRQANAKSIESSQL